MQRLANGGTLPRRVSSRAEPDMAHVLPRFARVQATYSSYCHRELSTKNYWCIIWELIVRILVAVYMVSGVLEA